MKTIACICAWGFLLSGGLAADTLYQINFAGTLTNGTATDFNLATNISQQVQDLTGLQVSGSLLFHLGAAPAPTVTTDNSGFVNTLIQTASGPVFTSESLQISGLTTPAGFLPFPAVLNQAPIPSVPAGATLTQTQSNQFLQSSTKPSGIGSQTILAGLNFANSWTGPQGFSAETTALDLLVSSLQPFFAVPAAGDYPASWSLANPGGNGVFTISTLSQNPALPDHLGITTDYTVIGNFAFNSVSGGFVAVPEPGMFLPVAALLVVVAVAARLRKRPAFSQDTHSSKSR